MNLSRWALVAAVACTSLPTMAGFVVVKDGTTSGPNESSNYQGSAIGEIGNRPPNVEMTRNEGANVPLGSALKMIAPAGWKGYSRSASVGRLVSWRKDVSWIDALSEVMRQSGSRAVIHWDDRYLTVVNAPVAKQPEPIVQARKGSESTSDAIDKSPLIRDKWTLKAGQRIDEQLREWGRIGGWEVNWLMDTTWVIPASATFNGSFDTAITDAIEAIYADGRPIKLKIYEGNRLMEITNNVPR